MCKPVQHFLLKGKLLSHDKTSTGLSLYRKKHWAIVNTKQHFEIMLVHGSLLRYIWFIHIYCGWRIRNNVFPMLISYVSSRVWHFLKVVKKQTTAPLRPVPVFYLLKRGMNYFKSTTKLVHHGNICHLGLRSCPSLFLFLSVSASTMPQAAISGCDFPLLR